MEFNLIQISNEINFKKGELEKLKIELAKLPIYQRINQLELEISEHEEKVKSEEQLIINYMLENDLKEIENMGLTYKVKDTSRPSVEVEDISLVPAEYIRIKKEVDKISVLKEYKETGVILPGINVIQEPKYKLDVRTKRIK